MTEREDRLRPELRLADAYEPSLRVEIAVLVTRLSHRLTVLEAQASAAAADRSSPRDGSGPGSAEVAFAEVWSPTRVLAQCWAQRELVRVMQAWMLTHAGDDELDHVLALVSAFSESLTLDPG